MRISRAQVGPSNQLIQAGDYPRIGPKAFQKIGGQSFCSARLLMKNTLGQWYETVRVG